MEHPGVALRGGEGVDVEEDVPGVVAVEVVLEALATPHAPRMVTVRPEVVGPRSSHGDEGDALGGVEDLADAPLEVLQVGTRQ